MTIIAIPRVLREALGEDATDALISVMNNFGADALKHLATKDDLAVVKQDISALRIELKREFEQRLTSLRNELKDDITSLRNELKDDILTLQGETKKESASIRHEIIRVEGELKLVKWMLGILIAGMLSLVIKAFVV
ncbi:hypothetical protein MCHI_000604 [Candidatus Magnetoovum chiemensis]|nr:hypothetical protein MCHI_000604 [Candidatus Magnetoovum chiemensis]